MQVEHIREHLDETNESTDLGIVDQAQSQVPMLLGPGRVTPSLEEILADVPPKNIADRFVSRYFTGTEPSISTSVVQLPLRLLTVLSDYPFGRI